MISDYKVKRRGDGVSPRTINYELTVMGHVFNIAIREWGLASENPVMKVKKERLFNKIERWLTLDEERQLLKVSPKWVQEIIIFAISTGLRQSEILDLKWEQIDMIRGIITISEQKNRGVDTLPLNKTALGVLSGKEESSRIASNFVFLNTEGNRIVTSNLARAFRLVLKKSGIAKLRFHDLRHTFASRLVQNGADLFSVQKLGRWKNTSMVMRYAHHYPESLRKTIEMIDKEKPAIITKLAQSQKKRDLTSLLKLVSG